MGLLSGFCVTFHISFSIDTWILKQHHGYPPCIQAEDRKKTDEAIYPSSKRQIFQAQEKLARPKGIDNLVRKIQGTIQNARNRLRFPQENETHAAQRFQEGCREQHQGTRSPHDAKP